MNLNNLKPAWKQFLLVNSMQPMDRRDILLIIEQADRQTTRKLPGFMTNTIIFVILILCCQAG